MPQHAYPENTHRVAAPPAPRRLASAMFVLLPCLAAAQDTGEAGAKRGWTIEPSVSLRQSFTDNQRLQTVKESDAITEASAAVRVTGSGGPLRGFLDYSLTGSAYARNSDANELRHFLAMASTAELVSGWAFVDLRGSYTQQIVSAFGSQSPDPALNNSNRQDVGSLSVAPNLRGRFGGAVRYEARLSYEITRAKGTDATDVANSSALLHLDSGGTGSPLGWTADVTHNVADYRIGRRTFDTRARAGVTYVINREFRVGVTAGQERTDLQVLGGASNATWGGQFSWTPTERTLLSAEAEKRFFGTGYSLQLTHRTPNTAWAVSGSRDISTDSSQGVASFGSAYDLFFRQFASTEPDAVKRDVLVRSFLQNNGINPNTVVVGGFLASSATLVRAQSASVALNGVRNTITLRAAASQSQRADEFATNFDDLSTNKVVRERGIALDWAFRLTPTSSINLTGSIQRNKGDTNAQETTLKAITVGWSAPLGARSTVSAGARHAVFESNTSPYDENALFAAIRLAF